MAADQNPSNLNAVATTSNSNLVSDSAMDFIVFCDTNLGFNIAMSVRYNDNVRDLKRKIMTEHAATFQDIGEIHVLAIKVENRGTFYHLPDSMVVRKAFEGDIGKCFLQIDAVPKVDRIADALNYKLLEAKTSSFELGQTTNDVGAEKDVSEQQMKSKMDALVVEGKGNVGNEKNIDGMIKQDKKSRQMKNKEGKLGLQIGNQAYPCSIEKKRCKKRKQKKPDDEFMENLKMEEAKSDINQPDLAQTGGIIAKVQGNLRDDSCENGADGNIEKNMNSQRENNNEYLPDLPADNNQAEFFSPEKKRRKKRGCITKQKMRDAKCDVNQPDSGEIALERNADNKDKENVLEGVCGTDASKNDFELLQPDLTKERKRKKKSSRHIHETVNKLDSETASDVPSLSKIGISTEAVNQVDEEDARKSMSNKNEDHEFPMERSAIPEHPLPQCSPATTEIDFTAADKVICRQSSRYTAEAPLEKVDATLANDQELNSHADFNKESDGEVGHQEVTNSGIIAKLQGNLRDDSCENDADGNIEKNMNSQRENNNEYLPDLPADNNQAEFFSPEKKRRKKRGCITKQKMRDAKCDVNQPDSGEIALERNADNKDKENVLGGVCGTDASKNDFELLQPDLTKERKRKKKSSRHIHETVNKLDSETASDVPSLSKIGISTEAVNQVDDEDARKSVSNKNEDHEFPIERSAIPEHPLPQCSPTTTENDFAAADRVIEELCRQSSRYTAEASLEKVNVTPVNDRELNFHADLNKESDGEVGHQEVTNSGIPSEVSTEIHPVKDNRVSQHNRKKSGGKPSSKNKLSDHSMTLADLGAVTATGNVEGGPNGYDDLRELGNGEDTFQDIPDSVDHELSTEARAKVHLAKDKGSHRSRKKSANVDSSYKRLSNGKNIVANTNISVSEISTGSQTFQSSDVYEHKVPIVDDGDLSLVSENVEQQKEVRGNPDNEVSEVSLPKVAPQSNRVEDLKAFDHVKGPTSAAEGVNFADFFCPQVDKQGMVVSAEEGRTVIAKTKRIKKQKLKRKRDKEVSNVHVQDSSTISANVELQSVASMGEPPAEDAETKERQRKLVYDGDVQNCNPSMQDRSDHSDNSQCSRDLSDTHIHHFTSKLSDSNMACKDKETVGVRTRKSHASKGSKKEQVSDMFSDTEAEMFMQKNEQVKISQYIKGMNSTAYDNVVEGITYKDSRPNNNGESHSNAADACKGACVKEMSVSKCALINNTDDKTNHKAGNYRIAVRKVPGRELEKLDNFSQDRTLLFGADTIFNHIDNALEDEPHKGNSKIASKRSCATSLRSSDRDGKLDEAKTVNGHGSQASMSFPGVTASATDSGKSKENHRNVTTTSGSNQAKSKLEMVLRNSSSYKKAKLALFQSQDDVVETQSVDVVMETQPESD